MQKLIKLSDTHYIVVDDSEIKVGDWCYSVSNGLIVEPNKNAIDTINSKSMEGIKFLKITHSTQPLEQYYGATDGTIPFVYHKIKPLSLSEVEEAINGYSVEKMAYQYRNEKWKGYFSSEYKAAEKGFIDGFNAYKELVKDKLFTVEDMEKAYEEGYGYRSEMEWEARYGYGDGKTIKGMKKDEYIQSLLPKTEWECTIDEQGKLKL